jgi:hypothetical protein
MSTMDRRSALKLIGVAGAVPLVGAFDWTAEEVVRSAARVALHKAASTDAFAPGFFTPHEWDTVRLLADIVIPADERSVGATEAGVPEFIDFMMVEGTEARRSAMREGLMWLDEEVRRRHGLDFLTATDQQRRGVLDDVAWPDRTPPQLQRGAQWFTSFRDLTGAGFFSSRVGFEDLRFMGNTVVPEWRGCPEAALRSLGVTYDLMNTRR